MTVLRISGAEHGVATLTTSGAGLASTLTGGTTISVQSTVKNTGSYAYRFNKSAAVDSSLEWATASAPTVVTGSMYFRFATFPATNNDEILFCKVAAGATLALKIDIVTKKIYARFWGAADGNSANVTISANTWYRVDWKFDVSTGTSKIDFQVDGVAATQSTYVQAATSFSSVGIGSTNTNTSDWYADDYILTDSGTDYPIGVHGIEWLAPTGEGTHSIAANTLEDASGADINGTTVLAYAQIDELPISESTTRIQQNGADNNSYFEVTLANITASHTSIIAAAAYLAYQSATATANNGGFTVSKDSFSTETTVWGSKGSLADYSESSMFYKSVIVAGVTDDTTVNALKFRGGWASDATPDPYWYNAGVEVAYKASTVLVIQDATHAHAADNLALTQHNILATQEARHLHAADNLALVQHNRLVIQDGAHAHAADNLTLTAHPPATPLVIQDATHAHAADNLVLTQHNRLAIQDGLHAHAADNLALTQHHVLVVQDASHAQTADNIALTQHNVLAIQDAAHSQTADNLTVTYNAPGAVTLVIQDGTHAHAADNLDLTQHNALVVQDAAHAHTADNLDLVQHSILAVQDAAHAHTADNVTLTQHHVLAIQDGLHSHTADNLTLVFYPLAGVTLAIQDGLHQHYAENITLTQHNILTIADASHGHTADNVTLSIPVLSGSILITVPVKKTIKARRDDVTTDVNKRVIIVPVRNDIEVD